MRYLLALFLPWLAFFSMGMIGSGIICLILQLTVIGWLPAAIWAFSPSTISMPIDATTRC